MKMTDRWDLDDLPEIISPKKDQDTEKDKKKDDEEKESSK